eukprot:2752885-Pyramimonas_sp.AAC.1
MISYSPAPGTPRETKGKGTSRIFILRFRLKPRKVAVIRYGWGTLTQTRKKQKVFKHQKQKVLVGARLSQRKHASIRRKKRGRLGGKKYE